MSFINGTEGRASQPNLSCVIDFWKNIYSFLLNLRMFLIKLCSFDNLPLLLSSDIQKTFLL